MTLPDLAAKHNIDPESAKAFLREWLDMHPVIAYGVESIGNADTDTAMFYTHSFFTAKSRENILIDDGWMDVKTIPLIARPELD